MTHKDYLPSLKSPLEEMSWGKKGLFLVKVTSVEMSNFMVEGL